MTTTPQLEAKPARDPREDWLSVTKILKLAGLSPWRDVSLEELRRGVEHGLDERRVHYILSGVYPEVLEAKREAGSNTHLAIRDIESGIEEAWWEGEPWQPFVSAYQRFKAETNYTATLVEYKVFHDTYQYKGTFDSLGMFNGGKTEALIDVKTSSTMDPSMGYQLAGYDAALPTNPKRLRLGLQLKNDGTYQVHEYKDKNDSKIFLAALTVATVKKGLQSL